MYRVLYWLFAVSWIFLWGAFAVMISLLPEHSQLGFHTSLSFKITVGIASFLNIVLACFLLAKKNWARRIITGLFIFFGLFMLYLAITQQVHNPVVVILSVLISFVFALALILNKPWEEFKLVRRMRRLDK